MRILCCGGREYNDRGKVAEVFERIFKYANGRTVTIIHGDCRGADKLCGDVAVDFGFNVWPFPVDNAIDGPWPKAGNNRNSRMLSESDPDYCIAFPDPDSRGTWDMVTKAARAGVPTRVYK